MVWIFYSKDMNWSDELSLSLSHIKMKFLHLIGLVH